MTVPVHRMAADQFLAIARGHGGTAALTVLRGALDSKTEALLTRVAAAAAGPDAALVHAAYRLLGELRGTAGAAYRTVLRHPVVGAWAMEAARRPDSPVPGRIAYLAAAAAVRSGGRHELDLPPAAVVPLPTLGHVAVATTGPLRLRTGGGGAELRAGPDVVRLGGDPRWCPTPRLHLRAEGLDLDIQVDPTSWLLAPGTATAGRHEIATAPPDLPVWRERLTPAWAVLTARHRPVAVEAAAAYSVLTPLVAPRRGHNSGTSHDAFGCVAMSLPPDPLTGAAALAHELQHTKLAALMDLFPLVADVPDEPLFYAPWRPDPRPARGLLQGAYAHLTLAAFWATQATGGPAERRRDAETRLARWRTGAHEAAHTLLDQAPLTPLGRTFVETMLDELHVWMRWPVEARAGAAGEREARAHRRRWAADNGAVPPRPHCPAAVG